MSINVTVNGNPVSIRRGRMVLSDLDLIKKNERDRRRKLRLEQVRQQSKEISHRLLQRAKNVTKEQLTQLEKDGRSELRQMHDRKIMDLQRKYQEDMEDIGRAHVSAAMQPDVEALLEMDRKKNRFIAVERGKEAAQRLRDSDQVEDTYAILHERQRQVREMENARAAMIANLPKKSRLQNQSEHDSDATGDKETLRKSPKKRKGKKTNKLQKSIPNVVVESPDMQVVISNSQEKKSEPQPGPSGLSKQEIDAAAKRSSASQRTITDISDLPRVTPSQEFDDQEPRRHIPILNSPSKADKVSRYNPDDYKPDSSTSSSSNSSPTTLSDDSSYFSDGVVEQTLSNNTLRHAPSTASSKVQLYDHSTRQRNAYNKPVGVVEKNDLTGQPNAEEEARAVRDSEIADRQLAENRKRNAQRRGKDAILRERVRRDYQNLMQNLDHLSREERKLRASQIHGPLVKDIHLNPIRRQELLAAREQEMNRAFETLAHNTLLGATNDEALRRTAGMTIPPVDERESAETSPRAVWQDPPFFEPIDDETEEKHEQGSEMSREEQILEMLRKVERQKRLLLKEFGADLPDDIFSASVKPLFSDDVSTQTPMSQKKIQTSPAPEIKVVNLSSCEENDKSKSKTGKKRVTVLPKKIEIAVQTSVLDEKSAAMDKGVQVELIKGKQSSSDTTSAETIEKPVSSENLPIEDIVESRSNSGSSDSAGTGIVIDIKKKSVKVTPRKKRSNLRISRQSSPRVVSKPRSLPGGKIPTPVKKLSRSAPTSKQSTPRSKTSESKPINVTDKKVKIQLDKGGITVKIDPPNVLEPSRDVSTDSSKAPSVETSRERIPVVKKQTKPRETSDTSTSYTSPPPPTPALYRTMRNNSTPVLEILEQSENESLTSKKRGISPVSSPGTPSPRTINLPTNTPHSRQINRVLEFIDSTTSDNTISNLIPGRQSTPNELPGYQPKKQTPPDRLDRSTDIICPCKNPQCKLIHSSIKDIENYASENYPLILQKYQDLQSMCTDRIASLTDLIDKVRSEQIGIELSVGGHSDESSMFLVPGPTSMRGDLQSVRKLVDSIEAIHSQLAKTLNESQRIIADEKVSKQVSILKTSTQPSVSTETDDSAIKESTIAQHSDTSSKQDGSSRELPRIISSERVNIPLSRYNILPTPQTIAKPRTSTSTSPSPVKSPRQEEDMVERLSKEILEQSKALDSIISQDTPDNIDQRKNRSPTSQHISSVSPVRQKISPPKEQRFIPPSGRDQKELIVKTSTGPFGKSENKDFIPLLAGIPKVQRLPVGTTTENHRPRPPVTLIHGPYRVQTGSPGHELSTIVEFDTPDTGSKSQKGARSPATGRTRKNLIQTYPGYPPGKLSVPSTTRSRTPVHTSSPLAQISASKISTKNSTPSPVKHNTKQSPVKDEVTSKSPELQNKWATVGPSSPAVSPERTVAGSGTQTDDGVFRQDISSTSSCSIPDISAELIKRNLIYHARAVTTVTDTPFRPKEPRQPVTSVSTEVDKDKITSTSSNSFSGLSGISEITSTPTSDILKYTSSPEEMETALKKLGLGWAITTLKKTREASALSSSSNSDATPINPSRKMISPVKKDLESKISCLSNLSDVSTISIKDANKSTERALLLKARTSTPNIENSNTSCEKPISSTTNSSRASLQDPSDSLTAPNLSLSTKKPSNDRESKAP
ncbi:serine-rich adhesin for platelets-like [Athalia rosae]|uniref:serine-rich adhesin for platelets-like n=1 Tax=Athalia rosae TaxID=37344 RepID=UPI00203454CE|nr:serine-rich adhesin for platelets-like [Athalia rosae]